MLDYSYKTILKTALPLMASSFVQSIVFLTDSAFLGRYDLNAYDAAGNAGLLYISFFIALSGMADGSQILIARKIGEKNTSKINQIFSTSFFIYFSLALLLFFVIQFITPSLLKYYSKHQDIANQQIQFLNYRSYGLFFAAITLTIQSFLFAYGKTSVVMISAIITAFTNIILDYLFIFGKLNFPELGLEGAALASTIADGAGMIFLIIYIAHSKNVKEFNLLDKIKFKIDSFKELIKLGSPILFQGVIALSTWTIFFTWIEQIGKFELTISQNIRGVYFLAFVPIWGFSTATKTYISQYFGKGDFNAISTIQKRIQILIIVFLFIFFHGAFFYPEQLISIINPSTYHQQKSGEILQFVAFSIVIYGVFMVYFQTINGLGKTKITFIIEIICIIIYLFSAYYIIKIEQASIFWIWSVEYLYFITMGILSIGYLKLVYKKII